VWEQAEKDLEINVTAPFILELKDGRSLIYIARILDFGSRKGTLVFDIEEKSELFVGKEYGYYCSALNMEYYKSYNRKELIETLEDWGYFGEEKNRPNWYSGKYYKVENSEQ